MTMNLAALGRKVRSHREQMQTSVADVAGQTGISPTRLDDIEAGRVEPSGDEVLILADHFRCDFRFFLSDEAEDPFERVQVLYRRHGEAFMASDRKTVQEFLYLCETEAFFMELLGKKTEAFSFRPTGTFKKGHGEKAAAALRRALGHEDNAVPMNVFDDFRRIGIHVFRRRLGNPTISGLFVQHPAAGACALVNFDEDVYRQRFSAAHEAAHALFDGIERVHVSFKNDDDLVEVRANRFASCYLMPPAFLARLPAPASWSDDTARDWANRLKVSCHALGIALKDAGLVDAARSAHIARLRVPKDDKIDPEVPATLTDSQRKRRIHLLERGLSDAYVHLCFDAFQHHHISRGRLAEALLTNQADLVDLSGLFGRSLHAR